MCTLCSSGRVEMHNIMHIDDEVVVPTSSRQLYRKSGRYNFSRDDDDDIDDNSSVF